MHVFILNLSSRTLECHISLLLYRSQWYTEWQQIDRDNTISSHVKISMISFKSNLSLKLYLNSLVYHRNIFGSSSEVFGSFWNIAQNAIVFRDMYLQCPARNNND